jgi:hypothetical protein
MLRSRNNLAPFRRFPSFCLICSFFTLLYGPNALLAAGKAIGLGQAGDTLGVKGSVSS